MLTILYFSVFLVLLIILFLIWYLIKVRKNPMANREFGYLRWVIYLINIVIFALSLSALAGIIYTLLSLFGKLDLLTQFSTKSGTGISFTAELSTFGSFVEVINLLAAIGILICMRLFMKNILSEEIFVAKNVNLARLSTVFLVLGSLIREGSDSASLILQSGLSEDGMMRTATYSLFNLNYLLAAVLVWTISIILEKAIAIADENEFTI